MTVALLVFSSVLFFARLLLLCLLHLLPGGVNPVRDPVSDYAVAEEKRTRVLATITSWAAAAAWICLGSALLLHPVTSDVQRGVGIWILILGILLATIPLVPTDRSGSQTTLRGRVHLLFAIAWFTLAYSTIAPLGRLLDEQPSHVLGMLHTVAGLALVALIVSLVVRPLRRRTFGIAERAFILAVTLAPLIASVDLAVRWLRIA